MGLDATSAIDYLKFLVNATAHPLNLAVGLKNSLKLVDDASWWLDFEVNEECASPPPSTAGDPRGENECRALSPFIAKGKPVFHVEYDEKVPGGVSAENIKKFCDKTTMAGFSTVLKRKELDSNTQYCP
jgi:endo-alpha-1,4-polygalactosaminidase (GH114 family)